MTLPGFKSSTLAGSYVIKPRVVDIDQKKRQFEAVNIPVWYEWRYQGRSMLEPAIITSSHGILTEGMLALPDVIDWENYGVNWRCWTSRPTDEQREAIPWIRR